MDKPSSSTNPDDVSDGNPVPEMNVDDIRTRDQDAETEVLSDPVIKIYIPPFVCINQLIPTDCDLI